jgi:hypothetical protein
MSQPNFPSWARRKILSDLERRIEPRYRPSDGIRCDVNLFVGEMPCPARLIDISRSGLGLVIQTEMDPQTTAIVTLANDASRFLCRELVYVRHTTERRAGGYHVGCQFVKELTAGDMRAVASLARSKEVAESSNHFFGLAGVPA